MKRLEKGQEVEVALRIRRTNRYKTIMTGTVIVAIAHHVVVKVTKNLFPDRYTNKVGTLLKVHEDNIIVRPRGET